jgi:LytS/YehU family sensor histidine kinase
VLLVAGFLVAVVVMKITLENTLVARTANGVFFRLFYSAGVLVSDIHLFNSFSACFFVLLTAILFTYFTESLSLRAKQAEISKRHMEAELNGLKAHVQPHFLFNSLNNLYYDTYKTMPRVADRIAMLSDIMRYFMEESPKSLVPLETELEFIHDFIQLEKVRISYPVDITVDSSVDQRLLVPPMLLIPLVENAFKHGLSELGEASFIRIALRQEGKTIRFTTTNRKIPVKADAERRGTGLKNLRERLALLFGENHSLQSRFEEGNHIAELIIPVYENEVRGGGR